MPYSRDATALVITLVKKPSDMDESITQSLDEVFDRHPSHCQEDNTADVALHICSREEMVWNQHTQPMPKCPYYSDYHSDHNDGSEI
jgi:hypothetical protein